jgi:hypothetical protein
MEKWRVLVNTTLNLRVPKQAGNLTEWCSYKIVRILATPYQEGLTRQKIRGRPSTDVQEILPSLTRGYKEFLQTCCFGEWETKLKKKFEPDLA